MTGWIKLHRNFINWEWYTDANTMRIFIHCLIKSNHNEKKWRGIDIKRGEFISSNSAIAKDLDLTISKIKTSIKKLILTSELTIKSCSQHTVFKVNNYDTYQGVTSELTNESPANRQPIATTKNVKNVKNDNKDTLSNSKELKKSKPKINFSDEDMITVNWMIKLIKNISPKINPKKETWANTIRLIRKSENVDHKHICEVFKWANADKDFWQTIILSPANLKKNFVTLDAKRLSASNNKNKQTHDFSNENYDEVL